MDRMEWVNEQLFKTKKKNKFPKINSVSCDNVVSCKFSNDQSMMFCYYLRLNKTVAGLQSAVTGDYF